MQSDRAPRAASWRWTCPDGHTTLRSRVSGGYYCVVCQQRFDGSDLVDQKKEGDA